MLAVVLIGIAGFVFGPQLVSSGREALSHWFFSRAQDKLRTNDLRGAVVELTRAIRWHPKGDREELANVYEARSLVLQRLGRFDQAAKDAVSAARIDPTPQHLNLAAYTRALAKVQLPDALQDVNNALSQIPRNDPEYPNVLDTRGYVLHLLERQEEALKDFNEAIDICEQIKKELTPDLLGRRARNEIRTLREMDLNLAVMYHHRGLVHEKLNHADQAAADIKLGDDLGYNPAAGIL